MDQQFRKFSVQLSFEEICLLHFDDMKVLPIISEGEILKADFKVRISCDSEGGE